MQQKEGKAPIEKASIVVARNLQVTLPSIAGPVEILKGISLQIAEGEALGLVGPSGSGKSTLLMVLAGLERPSHGTVAIDGHELTSMSEDDLARFRRDNVGIVFQSFHLIPTMTALENVAVPLELGRRRDAFEQAQARLEEVGLGHRLTHYPRQLSGGEQQRVALARAMVTNPKVILADEPTGNLDSATGAQIADLLFDLHDRSGTTLILITHDEALAARCGRVVRLGDGQIEGSDDAPGSTVAAQ